MARGNDGRTIFPKDSDSEAFPEQLAAARKRYPFRKRRWSRVQSEAHPCTSAGLPLGRDNSWAFPSPLRNSFPVVSKNTPSALFYVHLTVSGSNRHALTKMAIMVPECSRMSLSRTSWASPILIIMAIYQKLTCDVLGGPVMERDLPSDCFGRTLLKGRKFLIRLEEKHV